MGMSFEQIRDLQRKEKNSARLAELEQSFYRDLASYVKECTASCKAAGNGFRELENTMKVARDVFALQTIDGWGFDVEVLFIALQHGYQLIEVPITWYYRPQSRISPARDSIKMVLEVLRVRRNGWRGKYDRQK